MHDRRRVAKRKETDDERASAMAALEEFRSLYAACFKDRDALTVSPDVFPPQRKLLQQNPECYSIWAFRRRVFEALWLQGNVEPPLGSDGSAAEPPLQTDTKTTQLLDELAFNTSIITSDYKCYAAWVHRRWIINHLDHAMRQKVLLSENAQLEKLLRVDERNFHAWGYRRWVVATLQTHYAAYPPSRDLDFTEAKIRNNFGNYSAWHQRHVTTSMMVENLCRGNSQCIAEAIGELKGVLSKDRDMLTRAFYCDPADQSAWIYSPALLSQLDRLAAHDAVNWTDEVQSAVSHFQAAAYELAEDETDDPGVLKWPLWQIATLAGRPPHRSVLARPVLIKTTGNVGERKLVTVREVWTLLSEIDPLRRGYYRDVLRSTLE